MSRNQWCNLCQSATCDHATEFGILRDERDRHQKEIENLKRERDSYLANLTATQTRCTELLQEQRGLRELLGWSSKNGEHPTFAALSKVAAERYRQNIKWNREPGKWKASPERKLAVLIEEVGEIGRALLERDLTHARIECIQVAAVAVAMAETDLSEIGDDAW